MTTPSSQQEYIITEDRLFTWVLQDKITKVEADIVRSRLYTPIDITVGMVCAFEEGQRTGRREMLDEIIPTLKKSGSRYLTFTMVERAITELKDKQAVP